MMATKRLADAEDNIKTKVLKPNNLLTLTNLKQKCDYSKDVLLFKVLETCALDVGRSFSVYNYVITDGSTQIILKTIRKLKEGECYKMTRGMFVKPGQLGTRSGTEICTFTPNTGHALAKYVYTENEIKPIAYLNDYELDDVKNGELFNYMGRVVEDSGVKKSVKGTTQFRKLCLSQGNGVKIVVCTLWDNMAETFRNDTDNIVVALNNVSMKRYNERPDISVNCLEIEVVHEQDILKKSTHIDQNDPNSDDKFEKYMLNGYITQIQPYGADAELTVKIKADVTLVLLCRISLLLKLLDSFPCDNDDEEDPFELLNSAYAIECCKQELWHFRLPISFYQAAGRICLMSILEESDIGFGSI